MSARISASTVRGICSARKAEFNSTLAVLTADISARVVEAASQGKDYIIVEIPEHYIGRAPYDCVQMGRAAVNQLLEDGYYIRGTYVRFRLAWEKPVVRNPSRPLISVPTVDRSRRY